jgi:hypothetical chaperone protein
MPICGFDFGTSNSTLGVARGGSPELVTLEKGKKPLRSALFFNESSHSISFGEEAVAHYLEHEEGRLMTSLKSILGTSTMDASSVIFNKRVSFKEIIGLYVRHVKGVGEAQGQGELTDVVVGRPVHFNDRDPEKDRAAEDTLRQIFAEQGFRHIEFQFEPIAAAKTFSQQSPETRLAMIVDIGGGTSDFSILRTGAGADESASDIIATAGIHIGGTDIDQKIAYQKVMARLGMGGMMRSASGQILPLPNTYFHQLSTWHLINQLYTPAALKEVKDTYRYATNKEEVEKFYRVIENMDGHRVLASCETAKIDLVDRPATEIGLEFIEPGFSVELSYHNLRELIEEKTISIVDEIRSMLKSAGLNGDEVDAIYYTGGTSRIAFIREAIGGLFRNARTIEGDAFGSVGTGLTHDAMERFS